MCFCGNTTASTLSACSRAPHCRTPSAMQPPVKRGGFAASSVRSRRTVLCGGPSLRKRADIQLCLSCARHVATKKRADHCHLYRVDLYHLPVLESLCGDLYQSVECLRYVEPKFGYDDATLSLFFFRGALCVRVSRSTCQRARLMRPNCSVAEPLTLKR
jgi:hypothetical protein